MASLQLLARGTSAVASLAEELHAKIGQTVHLGRGSAVKASGITGFVYENIRRIANHIEGTAGQMQKPLMGGLPPANPASNASKKLFLQGILNGVMGDQLAETGHPFAFPMHLFPRDSHQDWRAHNAPQEPTDKVVIFIHGLCMTERAWQPQGKGKEVCYAQTLSSNLGYTPLFLRYNTGLHISDNGQLLAKELDNLVQNWPCPLKALTIVAHSMGGLVARSAYYFATLNKLRWQSLLTHLVFLGTPHHGAPLARAGNWVDFLLGLNRFSAPFTQLTQLRSAGITDLCHGNLVPEDWQSRSRFTPGEDTRQILPLPEDVACFAVAASKSVNPSLTSDIQQGDGLVMVSSALGQNTDPKRTLRIPKTHQRILSETDHNGLLRHPDVSTQIHHWFKTT